MRSHDRPSVPSSGAGPAAGTDRRRAPSPPPRPARGPAAAAAALLAAVLFACGPAADGTDTGGTADGVGADAAARSTASDAGRSRSEPASPGPAYGIRLTTDRAVYSPGDTIRMRLEVFRRGGGALTLSFPTAQRHDFVLRGPDAGPGEAVWRWSEGRFFAQSTATVTLDADRPALTATATRPAPGTPGLYRLEGRLTASDWPVSAVVPVTVTP